MSIRDIMTPNPRTCRADDAIGDVAQAMADGDFGACPVVDANGHPVGIVTDRDLALRGLAKGLSPDSSVHQVMTPGARSVPPEAELSEARQLMEQHQLRRLAVIDDQDQICGMIAIGDLACSGADRAEVGEALSAVSSDQGS